MCASRTSTGDSVPGAPPTTFPPPAQQRSIGNWSRPRKSRREVGSHALEARAPRPQEWRLRRRAMRAWCYRLLPNNADPLALGDIYAESDTVSLESARPSNREVLMVRASVKLRARHPIWLVEVGSPVLEARVSTRPLGDGGFAAALFTRVATDPPPTTNSDL
jgi:hypothetical protein